MADDLTIRVKVDAAGVLERLGDQMVEGVAEGTITADEAMELLADAVVKTIELG